MERLHDRIDGAFEAAGRWIARRAGVVLAFAAVLTTGLAWNLPELRFDTSIDGFLKPDDRLRLDYDEFRRQYGRDEMILVALRPREVFEPGFLRLLKTIHRDLEDHLPRLDEVTSLVNARNTYGRGDVLVVDDLLLDIPETPEELARFREQVMSDPIYRDLWISDDGTIANLAIESDAFDLGVSRARGGAARVAAFDPEGFDPEGFDPEGFDAAGLAAPGPGGEPGEAGRAPLRSEHNAEIVAAVREIVAKYRSPDLEIWVGGSPAMTARLLLAMERDLGVFMAWSVAMIALLLGIVFRRLAGLVLPLCVVALTITSMLGLMALLGIEVAFGTQILPSAILAVGIAYCVHLLTVFFRIHDATGDRARAIARALAECGVGISMSAFTTAIGFGSFATSDLYPLYRMGLVGPAGVALAYLYAIAVLPALLAALPVRARSPRRRPLASIDAWLVRLGDFAHRHARPVALATGGLVVASVAGATQLPFSHDPMTWLREDDPVRVTHDFLERELDGTMVMEVILDFEDPNALHDPVVLRKLDELASYARSRPTREVEVGKALSIVDVSKEIHQALHAGDPRFYVIPDERTTNAQELLLFESSGTDDLEKVTDSVFSQARVTLKVGWEDSTHYPVFIERIEAKARELFGPERRIYTTGMLPLMSRTMVNVMDSAARAYVLAFLVITPLMVLLLGRARLGLVSMVPNLFPIVATLALMWATGVALDMFTILVGSIALGLAVDDTIHFVHGFSRHHARSGSTELAVRDTMRSVGRAMCSTTAVLCAGFSVFMFSELNNLILFGVLTATAIGFALLADLLLTPALLVVAAGSATEDERIPASRMVGDEAAAE